MGNVKEKLIIRRNEKGEILPLDIHIKGLGDFKVTPLLRGEVLELMAGKQTNNNNDGDLEVVKKHLVEPKFTEQELNDMKWNAINMLSNEIFRISGVELSPENTEEDIKKNSTPSEPTKENVS